MRLKVISVLLIMLVFCPVCIGNNTDFADQPVDRSNNESSNIYSNIINYVEMHSPVISAVDVFVSVLVGLVGGLKVLMEIKRRRENRPIINVQCSDERYEPNSKIYISASNHGQSGVTLSSIGIEIPKSNKHSGEYLFPDTEKYDLPFPLESGARPSAYGYKKYISETEISEILKSKGVSEDVEAFIFLKNGTGRKFRCEKPVHISINSREIQKI